jgi:hypothetical protein
MVSTSRPSDPTSHPSAGLGPRPQPPLVRSWISLALVPVFFAISFVAQEGIYALTGYDPSTGDAPLWADLVAGLPGLAILLIPCVSAVVYGRRATREGVRTGLVPEVLGVLLGVGAVVLTVVNL